MLPEGPGLVFSADGLLFRMRFRFCCQGVPRNAREAITAVLNRS